MTMSDDEKRNLHEEMEGKGVLHKYAAMAAMRISPLSNGCWEWDGHMSRGIPYMAINSPKNGIRQTHLSVRRLLLMAAYGTNLHRAKMSKSSCGNVNCVRPLHWEGGKRKDRRLNMALGEADERWRRVIDLGIRNRNKKEVANLVRIAMGDGILYRKGR